MQVVKIEMERDLNEADKMIVELNYEIDTHRIAFAEYSAAGLDDLAAVEDELVRLLTDDLYFWYGRKEQLDRLAA